MSDRSSWKTPWTPTARMDLDIDIPRDVRAPALARTAVKALKDHLDTDVLADTVLLVSELVSNSVKYGAGIVGLRVRTRGTRQVIVEVLDEGDGFEKRFRRTSRFEAGGFGLRLVDRIASSWGVHDGAAHVWFEIDRSADLAAAA
ncbi:MAG: serine/threonine-protein kinase RsbW [Solirubrobacteraceae bacterium]|nr:serine/threonine-protein kinase RsbW [Solirubrobacteraceae bacterium]